MQRLLVPRGNVRAKSVDSLHDVIGILRLPIHDLAAQMTGQNLCRAVSRTEGQGNARTENRVEKLRRVADECKLRTIQLFDGARVTRNALRGEDELRSL